MLANCVVFFAIQFFELLNDVFVSRPEQEKDLGVNRDKGLQNRQDEILEW